MIALIDNYDSFTYNLYQIIGKYNPEIQVFKSDQINSSQLSKLSPNKIIISPGPKSPDESGNSLEIVQKFYTKVPILGICLGHQCIGQFFGSRIKKADKIIHGKTTKIFHNKKGLFKNINSPFLAARYHSLIVQEQPNDCIIDAWDEENNIMALRHKNHPTFGLQFHPESFMTENGEKIIKNFLNAK